MLTCHDYGGLHLDWPSERKGNKALLTFTKRLAKSETYLQYSDIGMLQMLSDIKSRCGF